MEETSNVFETQNKREKVKEEIDSSICFDIKRTLSHNCLFNFIVGSRGVGKTFSFKKWAIEDFLKNEMQIKTIKNSQKTIYRAIFKEK